ncbi:SdrD B-like domain-containing protein [Staphylococcus coagulans]|uniref:SdrD B-like domain-containing protein n=1 Tax=Staphylococcus coagulans TaxID=74706 RepID=UPI001C0AC849|nr:SdrD B-like domain-containing protein [Staphylococcus coagulans]MBU3871851.1 carboxypeptidase regulatory-like domain-containing protein [Staphylococcus coagulans]
MNNQQKFGIRKYKFGAASILLGTMFIVGIGQNNEAEASEEVKPAIAVETGKSTAESTPQSTDANKATENNEQAQFALQNEEKVDSVKEEVTPQAVSTQPVETKNEEAAVLSNKKEEKVQAEPLKSQVAPVKNEEKIEAQANPAQLTDNKQEADQSKVAKNISTELQEVKVDLTNVNNTQAINPQKAERLNLKLNAKLPENTRSGDFFEVELSDNINTNGISVDKKTANILLEGQSDVLAQSEVVGNKIKYTFTDVVNNKSNVNVNLELPLFIDTSKVLNNENINVKAEVGRHKSEKNLNVNYLNPVTATNISSLKGAFITLDKANHKFTHITYINPLAKSYNLQKVTFTNDKNSGIDFLKVGLNIYQVPNGKTPNQSMHNEYKQFDDITNNFTIKSNQNTLILTPRNNDIKQPLIVVLDGQFDDKQDINLKVTQNSIENHRYYDRYPVTLNWIDDIQLHSGKGQGNGENIPVPPIVPVPPQPEIIIEGGNVINTVEDSIPNDVIHGMNTGVDTEIEEHGNLIYLESELPKEIERGQQMGILSFEEDTVEPTYTIGDFVWEDGDHNGVQNEGETGLANVTVTLKNEQGEVVAETQSDAQGHYQFTNVKKGKYEVVFTTPEGYEATSKHTTANTEKDSDGLVAKIEVTKDDNSIDAGFFPLKNWNPEEPTYTIGDFVWEDGDHNGVQNEGEKGLANVTVTLKNEQGEVVAETQSDAQGHYQFTNVKKGKYEVVFTTPEGYEATSKHTTANTEKDSDGLVAKIDVTQDDNSIDAGFFPLKNWNPEPPMPEPPTPEKPTPPMPEPPTPEKPTPPMPEQPTPEKPTPPMPEQPTPEKPTPPMPKQPTPEKPTPPMSEQPTPKAPTPPMVQTPADQQQGKGQMKSSTNKKNQSMSKGEHETAKQLPNTGTSNTSQAGWLMGTLLLTLGTVMIGRKRKKEKTI